MGQIKKKLRDSENWLYDYYNIPPELDLQRYEIVTTNGS